MEKYFRFKALGPYVGNVSKSTVLRWVAAGKFPPPNRIGENVSAWSETQLEQWQLGIVGAADGAVAKKRSAARKSKKARPQFEVAP